ncbi:UDP-N-acetylmuramoyl-tripeptide--D-alanyl-D-alanine ligase [Winogradskyella sp. UBA3174]|uniref:UDP-N-acetylmuramoyl-tripeptide--D-alanyl-D- alanine ligase n=1 Tax=Winogradskyella sp. UBA3174 TaxID=1947785 RepID=UPI0025E34156|nr:UDP-N-acetylmuramoyl-tripeptide--D-alanyl-D-alanine ligase [Winogradskyella sp. UBA3174]|tara:strand:+ start:121 stop:1401 length:1281 start_codon:yes stop_codon:yes gene_type:complete
MRIDQLYQNYKSSSSISTDTRKLHKNAMYFALTGDNFNGNKFVNQAFKAGAKYCVVDYKSAVINDRCLLVSDVLIALQDLAKYHRKIINIPIIALTGSNGKTTTKELICAVLSSTYKVKATKGNLNNHIGVPLTLLSFSEDLDYGIVEMGANHQKEIEFLCTIAQPDFGLITNFGKAHLEGFGGIEGVIKGKSELYDYIKENHKTTFINKEDKTQIQQINNYNKITTFGSDLDNDCLVTFINADPFVTLSYDNTVIKSLLIGDYNYGNITVAVAIGKHFKVSTENIKKAIESYAPDNNRSEIIKKGNNQIILDAYNANPTSMLAALKNLKQLQSNNKYLFLGDMFELGKDASIEHQAIVNYVEANFITNIFLVGENFFKTETKKTTHKYSKFEDLKFIISNLELNEATILIKGSRGMALERILDLL